MRYILILNAIEKLLIYKIWILLFQSIKIPENIENVDFRNTGLCSNFSSP